MKQAIRTHSWSTSPLQGKRCNFIMKIVLATDHAGYELKEALKAHLISGGHDIEDVGAHDKGLKLIRPQLDCLR